ETQRGYPLRVISPERQALVLARSTTVKVRADRRIHGITASLNRKPVTLRRKHGLLEATLNRSQLRVGANNFAVNGHGPGGRVFRAHSQLIRAGRRAGLGSLQLARPARGPLSATLKMRFRRAIFHVYLNGRRDDSLFHAPGRAANLIASLSASDGMRFGRNRLSVYVFREDGRYWTASRTFSVSRRSPLAGAGADQPAVVGRSTQLNAKSSLPARAHDRLVYRWQIVHAPSGSRARLVGQGKATPSLRADRRGIYRVRLTVTELPRRHRTNTRGTAAAASSATDTVTVAAAPPIAPIGLPMTITGTTPNQSQIQIKGLTPTTITTGYTVVILNRATEVGGTLQLLNTAHFDFGQESALNNVITNDSGVNTPDNLVILVSTGNGTTTDPSDLQSAVSTLGGVSLPTFDEGQNQNYIPPAVVIGIPGT